MEIILSPVNQKKGFSSFLRKQGFIVRKGEKTSINGCAFSENVWTRKLLGNLYDAFQKSRKAR